MVVASPRLWHRRNGARKSAVVILIARITPGCPILSPCPPVPRSIARTLWPQIIIHSWSQCRSDLIMIGYFERHFGAEEAALIDGATRWQVFRHVRCEDKIIPGKIPARYERDRKPRRASANATHGTPGASPVVARPRARRCLLEIAI